MTELNRTVIIQLVYFTILLAFLFLIFKVARILISKISPTKKLSDYEILTTHYQLLDKLIHIFTKSYESDNLVNMVAELKAKLDFSRINLAEFEEFEKDMKTIYAIHIKHLHFNPKECFFSDSTEREKYIYLTKKSISFLKICIQQ